MVSGWCPRIVVVAAALAATLSHGPAPAQGPGGARPIERSAADAARPRHTHVLVLYSPPRHTGVMVWEDGFRTGLARRFGAPVHLHTEYDLEAALAGGAAMAELRHLLQTKYGRLRIDAVVAVGRAALLFARRHGTALFGSVPIVFAGVARNSVSSADLVNATGVWLTLGWNATVDAALRLQPQTRHVVLVSGTSDTDRAWAAAARAQLDPYEDFLVVTELTDLPLDEIVHLVSGLRDGAIVLLTPFLRDGAGQSFVGTEGRLPITTAARVPVYTLTPTPGGLGGHFVRFEGHGVAAGEITAAVLRGERPPPVEGPAGAYAFDARALTRKGLDERRLPAGSEVQHREPSPWERYRWYVVAALVFVAGQSALIGGLLAQRVHRRKAQRALDEQLRFERLLSELSSSFVAVAPGALDEAIRHGLQRVGEEMDLDRVSLLTADFAEGPVRRTHVWSRPGLEQATDVERDAFPWIIARLVRGEPTHVVDPDDLPPEAATDRAALLGRGIRSVAVVPLSIEQQPVGALTCTTRRARREWHNVVDRIVLLGQVFSNARARQQSDLALRQSHGRIRDLAGQLLKATEEERRRIAREIHDDLSQRIVALGIGLGLLERHLGEVDPALRHRIAELHERISSLGEHTRRLSHELHPAALQVAGLAAALREHCAEFRADTGIAVDLKLGPALDTLSPDLAVCLYRIAQAALTNVARHSGARRVSVVARIDDGTATLTVSDDGAGFKMATGRDEHGLGLVSMMERARLVGGSVEVRSAPGDGTEVRARVPISGEPAVERAS